MASTAGWRDRRGVIAIAEPTREGLLAAAALPGGAPRLQPADAVPAWLMLTAADCGGLVLVARHGEEIVGASFAIAAGRDGEGSAFSCGVPGAPPARRRGLGRALKLEQRRRALARRIDVIRW